MRNQQTPLNIVKRRTYKNHLRSVRQKASQVFQHEVGMGRADKDAKKEFLANFIANYKRQVN